MRVGKNRSSFLSSLETGIGVKKEMTHSLSDEMDIDSLEENLEDIDLNDVSLPDDEFGTLDTDESLSNNSLNSSLSLNSNNDDITDSSGYVDTSEYSSVDHSSIKNEEKVYDENVFSPDSSVSVEDTEEYEMELDDDEDSDFDYSDNDESDEDEFDMDLDDEESEEESDEFDMDMDDEEEEDEDEFDMDLDDEDSDSDMDSDDSEYDMEEDAEEEDEDELDMGLDDDDSENDDSSESADEFDMDFEDDEESNYPLTEDIPDSEMGSTVFSSSTDIEETEIRDTTPFGGREIPDADLDVSGLFTKPLKDDKGLGVSTSTSVKESTELSNDDVQFYKGMQVDEFMRLNPRIRSEEELLKYFHIEDLRMAVKYGKINYKRKKKRYFL